MLLKSLSISFNISTSSCWSWSRSCPCAVHLLLFKATLNFDLKCWHIILFSASHSLIRSWVHGLSVAYGYNQGAHHNVLQQMPYLRHTLSLHMIQPASHHQAILGFLAFHFILLQLCQELPFHQDTVFIQPCVVLVTCTFFYASLWYYQLCWLLTSHCIFLPVSLTEEPSGKCIPILHIHICIYWVQGNQFLWLNHSWHTTHILSSNYPTLLSIFTFHCIYEKP